MQTFLPYPSFAASARVLDPPRLGKQRVETLQILRALVVPTYGWQRHPAVGMWRGHVPALTAYGLAMVDAWDRLGHADTVRPQMVEFAPEVVGRTQEELAADGLLPSWLGDPAVHESHRSRLVAKDPAFYRPLFPDAPEDLEYVWPEPEARPEPETPHRLWIVRTELFDAGRGHVLLGLPGTDPRGRATPAWRAQLRALEDELVPGLEIGVLVDGDPELLHLGRVVMPAAPAVVDGVPFTAVAIAVEGNLPRRSLRVPAVLQNPRRVFAVDLDRPLVAAALDAESSP